MNQIGSTLFLFHKDCVRSYMPTGSRLVSYMALTENHLPLADSCNLYSKSSQIQCNVTLKLAEPSHLIKEHFSVHQTTNGEVGNPLDKTYGQYRTAALPETDSLSPLSYFI